MGGNGALNSGDHSGVITRVNCVDQSMRGRANRVGQRGEGGSGFGQMRKIKDRGEGKKLEWVGKMEDSFEAKFLRGSNPLSHEKRKSSDLTRGDSAGYQ